MSFFSLLTPFTSAISFNFTTFSSTNSNISYDLSANAENQVIKLTDNMQAFAGRATYFRPMHLWVEASGNLTDFTTHFTFVINSSNFEPRYNDGGLAFFLAPNGSKLPVVKKSGGLGLAYDDQEENMDANHFFAVEFDIYQNNVWDPLREHVGIDINSTNSVVNLSWPSRTAIREGQINEAWISYNSSSFNLSVMFTVFNRSGNERRFLSYIIDLRISCLNGLCLDSQLQH